MPALVYGRKCALRLFCSEINLHLCEAVNEMWKPEASILDVSMGSPFPLQYSYEKLISIFQK